MKPIKKMPRAVRTLVQKTAQQDIDPSLRLAMTSIQRQINSLYEQIAATAAATAEAQESYATINNNVITLTNKSGGAVNNGDVVIWQATDESFTTTTTKDNENVIGVVYSDSSDGVADAIEDEADGLICIFGQANVNCDTAAGGAISVGDYLITTTAAGTAQKAESTNDTGIFAMALEALPSGTGTIYCILFQPGNALGQEPWVTQEILTADSASQITLSDAAYDDPVYGVLAFVIDTDNLIISFPFGIVDSGFFSSHGRCVLTKSGSTIQNSESDFSTAAGAMSVLYLRNDLATEIFRATFKNMLHRWLMMCSVDGRWLDSKGFALRTRQKNLVGAINENRNVDYTLFDVHNRYEFPSYDSGGAVTGLSGALLSATAYMNSTVNSWVIWHRRYGYSVNVNSNVLIISQVTTYYIEDTHDVDRTVKLAFEYTGDLLNKISQDLT